MSLEMGVEGGTLHVSCKRSTKIGRLEEAGVRGSWTAVNGVTDIDSRRQIFCVCALF